MCFITGLSLRFHAITVKFSSKYCKNTSQFYNMLCSLHSYAWRHSARVLRKQSGPQPDLDIWWSHLHLQNGAHAEKHEGRSLLGSLLRLEVSFPHTTLRAVTLDNEKSGVWRKNAVRWTFVRSWEVKRPNTRVFQLKEMPDKEQNIKKKEVSVIFWTVGINFFDICIQFACW